MGCTCPPWQGARKAVQSGSAPSLRRPPQHPGTVSAAARGTVTSPLPALPEAAGSHQLREGQTLTLPKTGLSDRLGGQQEAPPRPPAPTGQPRPTSSRRAVTCWAGPPSRQHILAAPAGPGRAACVSRGLMEFLTPGGDTCSSLREGWPAVRNATSGPGGGTKSGTLVLAAKGAVGQAAEAPSQPQALWPC